MRVIDWVAEEILASGAPEERGCRATAPCPQAKLKKKHIFVDTLTSKVLRDLRFSQNQSVKSTDDWYTGTLKNIERNLRICTYFF